MVKSSSARPSPGRPTLARRRLRFMTCGSVDDGKSTLIGRLLHDSGAIFEDHVAEALKAGGSDVLDFSFLVDGLKAEREQGITIDVAYRYFITPRRAFLIADAPGHEQYTRNQAAASSQTELAIVVISAPDGVRRQTRRHMTIAAMFGVRDIVIAVNKMDLVGWDKAIFDRIAAEAGELAGRLGQRVIGALPLSAREGGNVTAPAAQSPWHDGATLKSLLETFEPPTREAGSFLMPIQAVARLDGGGRVILGEIKAGKLKVGDTVRQADGLYSVVTAVWRAGAPTRNAASGDAVALRIEPERDLGRGMVLSDPERAPVMARQIKARFVMLSDEVKAGRTYDIQIGSAVGLAAVSHIEGVVDIDCAEVTPVRQPPCANDIIVARLFMSRPVPCLAFADSNSLGSFILIERMTGHTVAAGVVLAIDQTEGDVPSQRLSVTPEDHARLAGQKPVVYWLTGLSGSGKSTIATLLETRLMAAGCLSVVLDGDNLRRGLNEDLGFSEADRIENMRRVAHVAALMADAGLNVIVSLISPFAAERKRAAEVVGAGRFLEVFVDAPIEVCAQRDPKGHYRRAAAGTIRQFTGVTSDYEAPATPDVHLRTDRLSPEEAVKILLDARIKLTGAG